MGVYRGWEGRGMGREGEMEGRGDGKGGGWEERATGSPIKRKTFRARTRANNKLDPHLTPGLGIEPGHSGVR